VFRRLEDLDKKEAEKEASGSPASNNNGGTETRTRNAPEVTPLLHSLNFSRGTKIESRSRMEAIHAFGF